MAHGHRRAGAATAIVLLLAGVLLLGQPRLTEQDAGGVVRRFLGSEKDQTQVAHDEEKRPGHDQKGEQTAESKGGENNGGENQEQPGDDKKGEQEDEAEPEEKLPRNQSGDASSVEDDQDEQGSAVNETSLEGLNATELELYYDKVFDKIEGAEFLPPWFLVPFLVATKEMLTLLIFGFDMRFKPQEDAEGCLRCLMVFSKDVARAIFQLLCCALVVNGYRSDWVEYRLAVEMLDAATPGEGISTLESLVLFAQVMATSGNFAAAGIVFVATLEQILPAGTPKYLAGPIAVEPLTAIRFSVFPWIPCSTHWMPKIKHLYMYLLLPYVILPQLCGNVFSCAVYCSHCCGLLGVAKVMYGFPCCVLLSLSTLTLVPYFYDTAIEFGVKLVPFWYFCALFFENLLVTLVVGSGWLIFKCRLDQLSKLLPLYHLSLLAGADYRNNILQGYAHCQSQDVRKDFIPFVADEERLDQTPPNGQEYAPVGEQQQEPDVTDIFVQTIGGDKGHEPIVGELYLLMMVTYRSLILIVLMQIGVLVTARMMMTGHVFASYAAVMHGRSWDGYTRSLSTQMHGGMTQAAFIWEHRDEHLRDLSAALEVVSKTLNAIWTS